MKGGHPAGRGAENEFEKNGRRSMAFLKKNFAQSTSLFEKSVLENYRLQHLRAG